MSEKELSQYYYLKKEIKSLEDKIEEFGDGVGAVRIKETMINVNPSLESIQEKRMLLINQLIDARLTALEKYLEIERYIESVDDPEIRMIMRLRFLDLKDWYTIGEELYCNRTTVTRKLRKYIKLHKVAHNTH